MAKTEEILLIERTKAGDMEAFDELFHLHSHKLYSFAFGLLKTHAQTEDLVQDIFIIMWERREQINPAYQFENYLFTIAYHAILKVFRRKKMEKRVMADLYRSSPPEPSDSTISLHCREMEEAISLVVESMPPRRKEVFKKSREDGWSIFFGGSGKIRIPAQFHGEQVLIPYLIAYTSKLNKASLIIMRTWLMFIAGPLILFSGGHITFYF